MREDILRSLSPDVADWSVGDVCFYIKSHGFPAESKLFEEQVWQNLFFSSNGNQPVLIEIDFRQFLLGSFLAAKLDAINAGASSPRHSFSELC